MLDNSSTNEFNNILIENNRKQQQNFSKSDLKANLKISNNKKKIFSMNNQIDILNNSIDAASEHLDDMNVDTSHINLDDASKTTDSEHNIDNISTASSPSNNTSLDIKDDDIKEFNHHSHKHHKQANDSSMLSSSGSSSSASLSPNLIKSSSNSSLLHQAKLGPDWYKQYEDSLKLFNHHRNSSVLAGLHNFIKPTPNQQQIQSSPISAHTTPQSQSQSSASSSLSDSSLLMERFYNNIPTPGSPFTNILKPTQGHDQISADKLLAASHQALLAQYAQQFYINNGLGVQPGQPGHNHLAAAMAAVQHNQSDLIEKERERYLASLNFGFNPHHAQNQFNHHMFNQRSHESPRTPSGMSINTNMNLNNNQNMKDSDKAALMAIMNGQRRARGNSSGNSRSPSPSSSQHSGQIDCEEDEDNCGDDSQSINAANGEWTYEEQFKQLYELSDDAKRKEFLDDLFSFMQKRGSPVNRIPIMAKHVLDLYELYRLVVSKGGLVEVINKKLWREITKGLNLPSSITSAAFTLRTQYMKYLYPYECEKLKMSTPGELQAAIDGNRREGRRPVYGYDYASPTGMNGSSGSSNQVSSNQSNIGQNNPSSGIPQNVLPHQMHHPSMHPSHHQQHPLMSHPHQNPHHAAFLAAAAAAAAAQHHHSANHLFEQNQNSDVNSALQSNHQLPGHGQQILPPFLKPYFEMNTPPSSTTSSLSSSSSISSETNTNSAENRNSESETFNGQSRTSNSIKRPFEHLELNKYQQQHEAGLLVKEPSSKKISLDVSSQVANSVLNSNNISKLETNGLLQSQHQLGNLNKSVNGNKMNLKIFSKESAEQLNLEKSLSISLEINGLMYQGTLFATRLENNAGIQIQIPMSNNESANSAFTSAKKHDSSASNLTSLTAIKTDVVF